MCAFCTVNKETGFGMTDRFQCNVQGVERSTSCLNEIKEPTVGNNLKIPSKTAKQVIQGIVGKDQRKGWPIMQMSYLVNDWKY